MSDTPKFEKVAVIVDVTQGHGANHSGLQRLIDRGEAARRVGPHLGLRACGEGVQIAIEVVVEGSPAAPDVALREEVPRHGPHVDEAPAPGPPARWPACGGWPGRH